WHRAGILEDLTGEKRTVLPRIQAGACGVGISESWQLPFLIVFWPGLFPAVVGVLVGMAVCKSRFAFWAGVVAYVLTVGWLLIGLHDRLTSEAYWIMAIPLPVALLAMLLSFRPAV